MGARERGAFRAMRFICGVGLVGAFVAVVFAQGPAPKIFKSAELGFSLAPPQNSVDFTAADQESLKERAAAAHTTNISTILLALDAPTADTAQDWFSVNIEDYPREKLANFNDHDACVAYAQRVARLSQPARAPEDLKIGSTSFVVVTFRESEPPIMKQAQIYVTILKGKLVGFAFVANSPDVLEHISPAMKTFTLQ